MLAIKLYFQIKKSKYILTWKVAKEKCFAKVNAQNILKHCPATILLIIFLVTIFLVLSAKKKNCSLLLLSYSVMGIDKSKVLG